MQFYKTRLHITSHYDKVQFKKERRYNVDQRKKGNKNGFYNYY